MNKLTQRIILLIPLLLVLTTFSAAYSSEKSPRLLQLQQLEKAAFSGNFPKNCSLENIDTTRMSQKEKALYILIQTKIALKTQNISLHDTLLHTPIRHFKAQKDAKRLAESYYLQGEIYRLNHFFLRATDCYDQAALLSNENRYLQYWTNIRQAQICRFKMSTEAHNYLKKALWIAQEELNDKYLIAKAFYEQALCCINEQNFPPAIGFLTQAISLLDNSHKDDIALFETELSNIYLMQMQPDSALIHIENALAANTDSISLPNIAIRKGYILGECGQTTAAMNQILSDISTVPMTEQIRAYRELSKLNERNGNNTAAAQYLKKHVLLRDSLDADRKEELIEKIQSLHEYKRQRERARQAEQETAEIKLIFYRLFALASIGICLLCLGYYRTKQNKRKLSEELKEEKIQRMEMYMLQQETEIALAQEKEKQKQHEIEKLNQNIEYYKRLNAITLPILMRRQNAQGALHLQDEDWEIIVHNTDACFNRFTTRLKEHCNSLTEEELRFCCLIKMELPMALLAEIYHIAKGSISRKKMRLKEKMHITEQSFDEFISAF